MLLVLGNLVGIADSSQRKPRKDDRDFYQTPFPATRALIEFLNPPKDQVILDPCEGKGAITQILREYHLPYKGIDLYPQLSSTEEQDFLHYEESYKLIIGNPPYYLKNDFIEKALTLAVDVWFILPMQVVNYNIFHREYLDREDYIGRLLLTPKFIMSEESGVEVPRYGGISSYAWFHWSSSGSSKGSIEHYADIKNYIKQ